MFFVIFLTKISIITSYTSEIKDETTEISNINQVKAVNIDETEKSNHKLNIKVSGSCGLNVNFTLETNRLLISGEGDMYDYSSQDDVPWYPNYTIITSVRISNGVTRIGNYSFYFLLYCTSITIPDSITSIGYYAFGNCESLQTLRIPDKVQSIGPGCFSYCHKLRLFTIPKGITTIRERTFYSCGSISTFSIPESVTSIEEHSFVYSGLTNITINDNVKSIGMGIFSGCLSLTNVSLPSQIASIPFGTFNCCRWLVTFLIPPNVTSIEDSAFRECDRL